jgi:glycosyltransferase involved in cell wall biosynthesis
MPKPWPVLLMVRELGLGGSERQTVEIARSLDRAEFTPHVACFHSQGLRRRDLEDAGVPILTLPVRSLLGLSALDGARLLRRYIRGHAIQLVHTFDTPSNLFGVPAARLARTPVVLSSQRVYRELTPLLGRRLLRITDRMADGVVVNCQALVRHMIQDEGVQPSRVLLCHNGIDTEMFQPGSAVLRSTVLKDAELVAGIVCGVRAEKGLDLLLQAFARIAAPGRKLVIVGGGPIRSQIEALASQLSLQPYCHFEPATSGVADWLRAIDVFVLPSRSEALSNSLMEAMACGCAVIASDTGGNPELVAHDSTGLLFPSGDVEALASALTRLADNASLRASLGARAASFIRERFTLAMAAQRMAAIYRKKLAPEETARDFPAKGARIKT